MVALNFEHLILIQIKTVLKILYCLETKVEKLSSADALMSCIIIIKKPKSSLYNSMIKNQEQFGLARKKTLI